MKEGDLTTEQQCQMIAEASAWRDRALKAEASLAAFAAQPATMGEGEAIDMVLHCPKCGEQHIDEPEHVLVWTGGAVPEPSHDEVVWENPPHRSHLCHGCGCIWRPADVPTNGVRTVATAGKVDNWNPATQPAPIASPQGVEAARNALKPFAKAADEYRWPVWEHDLCAVSDASNINVGHLRAARAALAALSPPSSPVDGEEG